MASIITIITTLFTSEWFWTAVIVPFVLWVLSRIGAKYNKENVEKALDILKQLVIFAISLAETEAKKGNLTTSKKEYVIKYVLDNCPAEIKKAIPNLERILPSIIESLLMSSPEKFGFSLFTKREKSAMSEVLK